MSTPPNQDLSKLNEEGFIVVRGLCHLNSRWPPMAITILDEIIITEKLFRTIQER